MWAIEVIEKESMPMKSKLKLVTAGILLVALVAFVWHTVCTIKSISAQNATGTSEQPRQIRFISEWPQNQHRSGTPSKLPLQRS